MFQGIKNLIAYGKTWFERALTEPDVNSRLVFLIQGMVTSLSIVAVTAAFIIITMFTNRSAERYEYYLYALAGSGAGASVGRYFTKKNSNPAEPQASPPVTDPAATVPSLK